MPRSSYVLLKLLMAVLVLAMLILGVKGASLWNLQRDLDTDVESIAAFYDATLEDRLFYLSVALLTADQKRTIASLTQTPLSGTATQPSRIAAIITAQQLFTHLSESAVATPLADTRPFQLLQKELGTAGKAQLLLKDYNAKVQQWNNQQDDPLGRLLWTFLLLKPRLLLHTNGTSEYETTATL